MGSSLNYRNKQQMQTSSINRAAALMTPGADRILTIPTILYQTGFSRSTLYSLWREKKFPAARRVSARRVGVFEFSNCANGLQPASQRDAKVLGFSMCFELCAILRRLTRITEDNTGATWAPA